MTSHAILHSRSTRFVIAAVGLLACFWGMWTSGRAGFSREEASHARNSRSLNDAQEAVRLGPGDPKAFEVRAEVKARKNGLTESLDDLKIAVSLRPQDYLLWLKLGYARERLKDLEGALAAYQEAARLAPYYGQPNWYVGNMLLALERRDEAFVELTRAATSNPDLYGQLFTLAWKSFKGDAAAVSRAVQPQTPTQRLWFARYFVENGNATAAIENFRLASNGPPSYRRQLLSALLAAKNFAEAYEVWAAERNSGGVTSGNAVAKITDAGFEGDIRLGIPGFGWQVARDFQHARIALDTVEPHSGSQSLRFDWSGNPDPSIPVVSQLVLVSPATSYRLSFSARTRELLTVGLPFVAVVDANDDKQTVLGQSHALEAGTNGWQFYKTEFTTGANTRAVFINLRRERCDIPQCAILGNLWLDDFVLEPF